MKLTPYDTGERCQPKVWPLHAGDASKDRYGRVDFDNDESATVVTVYVESSDDGYVLHYSGDVTVVDDEAQTPPLSVYELGRCAACNQPVMRRVDVASHQNEWGIALEGGQVYGSTNCAARAGEPGDHARPHLDVTILRTVENR